MKTGLICDKSYAELTIFDSFRFAITSLYPDIKDVNSTEDLNGLDVVFLPHPNHGPHLRVCGKTGFVEKCNELGIFVVIFFSEIIRRETGRPEILYVKGRDDWYLNYFKGINPVLFDDVYSDEDQKFRYFKYLNTINNRIIYAYDVDDCIEFKLKLFRVAISKKFKHLGDAIHFSQRQRGIAFCGSHYKYRLPIMEPLKKWGGLSCMFVQTNFKSWYDYMKFLSAYQFVLSPFGNSNAFVARFYEALTLKSIVLQQVKDNTLQYYDKESTFPNCIFFKDTEELIIKINEYSIPEERAELWLEDVLAELLKQEDLL